MSVTESGTKSWLWVVVILGAIYVLIGVVFGEIANGSGSDRLKIAWRLAAWIASGAAFALHVWHESVRLHSAPRRTALHVSFAAALGAFGLAVAANIHAITTGLGNRGLLYLALLLWPLLTWIPAFLVALVISMLLLRIRGNQTK